MIKFVLENFDTIFRNEKSLESLNKIILDLAIRGKLVEQNPEDEPASELLMRIKEEKDRLIKEKVIKKEKELPKIEKDEIPFEIPESWEWVRLGEIIELLSGQDISMKECNSDEKGIPYLLGASNIIENKLIIERWIEKPRVVAIKNDILISCKGTVGKLIICNLEKVNLSRQLMGIRILKEISKEYMFIFLKSYVEKLKEKSKGLIPGIAREDILNIIFLLPPLAEQQRIVEKVERLQELTKNLKEVYISNEESRLNLKKSLLAEIEKSNSDKELLKNLELVFGNFDKVIRSKEDIKDIRNLILSLAIKGKLVKQNPEDEPASELLKRIKEEKDRLIKEKVIKKEKELPKIKEEEIPFEIPKSWENERLGNLLILVTKGATPTTYGFDFQEKGINFLKVENVKNGIVMLDTIKTFISEEANIFQKRSQLKENDILFSIAGTIGETCIIKKEYLPANTNQAFAILRGGNIVFELGFLKLLLNSLVLKKASILARGGAMNNISLEDIKKMFVLILPLAEQQRIVERVEKLMRICDMLEEKIVESERVSEKLLESLVKYEG